MTPATGPYQLDDLAEESRTNQTVATPVFEAESTMSARKRKQHARTHTSMSAKPSATKGLRAVALFEGAKGMLVILAGCGLLSFIHKDIHAMAVRLVEHLHFNPAKQYPRIFLDATERVTDSELWALAGAALMYSGVRFFEAAGLWFGKKWAEWFGVLTGGMYIPVELYEVARSASWPKVILLAGNIGVVSYLLYALNRRDTKLTAALQPSD